MQSKSVYAGISFTTLAAMTMVMEFAACASGEGGTLIIKLNADEKGIPAGPVWVKPPTPLKAETFYTLKQDGKESCLGQVDGEGRLWWMADTIESGRQVMLTAEPLKPTESNSQLMNVKVKQVADDLVEVTLGQTPFTAFHFNKKEPKPFLWPVIGPTGDPVTRAYPMKEVDGERKDHIHHRSIWAAWGDIRTKDLGTPGTNYWQQAKDPKEQDYQIVKRIVRTVSGPVFGQVEAEVEWINRHGQREFSENRTYTFFAAGPDKRIIDVRNIFHFNDVDVTFADTKEAGILSVRVATSMDEIDLDRKPGKGKITNAQKKEGMKNCWGLPSEWCDYSGPVNGKAVGIAIFDAKTNLKHPPRWHVRDYGLYAVNPFSTKAFPDGEGKNGSYTFKKGESADFNYRIVIHKEDAEAAGVANQYRLYANPPSITVVQ